MVVDRYNKKLNTIHRGYMIKSDDLQVMTEYLTDLNKLKESIK